MRAHWRVSSSICSPTTTGAPAPARPAARRCARASTSNGCSTTSARCIASWRTVQSARMRDRRWLLLVLALAALHGAFYIWYQRPDWYTQWSDQDGYRKLGAALATTGRFTRFPESREYVPEVIRTPGYPAFVGLVYAIAGVHQLPVTVAQTALFVIMCALVYAMGREIADGRVALGAAAATALYSPIPYFGGLVVTEVFATLWLTVAVWLCLRARRDSRPHTAVAAGMAMGIMALVRPAFALLPFFMF